MVDLINATNYFRAAWGCLLSGDVKHWLTRGEEVQRGCRFMRWLNNMWHIHSNERQIFQFRSSSVNDLEHNVLLRWSTGSLTPLASTAWVQCWMVEIKSSLCDYENVYTCPLWPGVLTYLPTIMVSWNIWPKPLHHCYGAVVYWVITGVWKIESNGEHLTLICLIYFRLQCRHSLPSSLSKQLLGCDCSITTASPINCQLLICVFDRDSLLFPSVLGKQTPKLFHLKNFWLLPGTKASHY